MSPRSCCVASADEGESVRQPTAIRSRRSLARRAPGKKKELTDHKSASLQGIRKALCLSECARISRAPPRRGVPVQRGITNSITTAFLISHSLPHEHLLWRQQQHSKSHNQQQHERDSLKPTQPTRPSRSNSPTPELASQPASTSTASSPNDPRRNSQTQIVMLADCSNGRTNSAKRSTPALATESSRPPSSMRTFALISRPALPSKSSRRLCSLTVSTNKF